MTRDKLLFTIRERLKLETNRRIFDREFGLSPSDLLKPATAAAFKEWGEERRTRFLDTLGGPVNRDHALALMDNIAEGN